MINKKQTMCNLARTKNGEVATYLKNLSQLIGALFSCDSRAKIELRS